MRYIGLDLAWGERARTGLAVLDPEGRLVWSASVVIDDEIARHLGDVGDTDGVVAAIDAPLVVVNETGQRACEREVGRDFGRYSAGAYPANRGNAAFNPEPRGARLARRFGWDVDPAVRPGPGRGVAIEVYPHPAMVSLFGLDRVIPYKGKKGRDVAARQAAFTSLFAFMEATCGPLLPVRRFPALAGASGAGAGLAAAGAISTASRTRWMPSSVVPRLAVGQRAGCADGVRRRRERIHRHAAATLIDRADRVGPTVAAHPPRAWRSRVCARSGARVIHARRGWGAGGWGGGRARRSSACRRCPGRPARTPPPR